MTCAFCGRPDSPLREVQAPIPVLECYCDGCAAAAAAAYGSVRDERRAPETCSLDSAEALAAAMGT